ncbi:MAG: U32 family peptidase [Candidatus Krumholzibacteria bacterium]|nr:U32 family peptidase [Candidatus Krumholzibacteria bacterium]
MELLAPAGTLEKLKWAAQYGADAVYFGTEFGSLRSYAGNFTLEDAAAGLAYLHARGKKGYVALNIYPWSDEFERLTRMAQELDDLGVDALIVADLGVLTTLRRMNLKAKLHISTQASTTNYQSVQAYGELGASRVNLARELSLEQIQAMQTALGGAVETEVFVHGAVCFSYSGRCAISDYLTGHGANRGECKQPCRWKYSLVEEKRPGQVMDYTEDERGSYFFNSRELALFEYVPALKEAQVASVKLEGRMKSIHYIASIVSFYRQIIDGKKVGWDEGVGLLNRVPNRGYSTGFMKGEVGAEDYAPDAASSSGESIFVGNVLDEKIGGSSVLEVRNKITAGQELELLTPDGNLSPITMPTPLVTRDGDQVAKVNNSQFLQLEQELPPYSILRRIAAF